MHLSQSLGGDSHTQCPLAKCGTTQIDANQGGGVFNTQGRGVIMIRKNYANLVLKNFVRQGPPLIPPPNPSFNNARKKKNSFRMSSLTLLHPSKIAFLLSTLLAPSGVLKMAPGRYPTIPTQSTYSFQCSISFNYDQKGYKDRYKDRNKDRHKYRLIKVN